MKPNSLDNVGTIQVKQIFQKQMRSRTGMGPWHKKNKVRPQREADRRELSARVLSQIPMIVGQITRLGKWGGGKTSLLCFNCPLPG